MDVCPICFGTSQTLPLDFAPTGIRWSYNLLDLLVFVDFPQPMDISVQPLPADFTLSVDGVPKVPDSVGWSTPTELEIEYSEGALGPVEVLVNFPASVPNFRSPQMFLVQPFIIVGVEIP